MQFKVRVIGTDPYERLRVPIGFAFPAMVYALADTIVGPVLIPTLAFAWMAALVAMSTAERERGMGVKAVMALNGGLLVCPASIQLTLDAVRRVLYMGIDRIGPAVRARGQEGAAQIPRLAIEAVHAHAG